MTEEEQRVLAREAVTLLEENQQRIACHGLFTLAEYRDAEARAAKERHFAEEARKTDAALVRIEEIVAALGGRENPILRQELEQANLRSAL